MASNRPGTLSFDLPMEPSATSLELAWKNDLPDANKVLVALLRNGRENCFCRLRVLTGLAPGKLFQILKKLQVNGYVRLDESPLPEHQTSDESHIQVALI